MNDLDEINRRIQGFRDKLVGQIAANEIDEKPGVIPVSIDLLNELLNTSANDATEFEINRSDFNLAELTRSVVLSFQQS